MIWVKINEGSYREDQIISVRRTKPVKGRDDVVRSYVVRVTRDAAGVVDDSKDKFCSIWASDEEAEEVMALVDARRQPTYGGVAQPAVANSSTPATEEIALLNVPAHAHQDLIECPDHGAVLVNCPVCEVLLSLKRN